MSILEKEYVKNPQVSTKDVFKAMDNDITNTPPKIRIVADALRYRKRKQAGTFSSNPTSNADRARAELLEAIKISRRSSFHMCSMTFNATIKEKAEEHWVIGFTVPDVENMLKPLAGMTE
jgi:hypothetical protein